MSDDSALEIEFDVMARWTLEAVRKLGPDHAVPAACRGSASPAALAWLGEACELAPGLTLVDVGGGTGGPAAFAAERFGVTAVVVEPMPGACGTAREFFGNGGLLPLGLQVVIAPGDRVPLADGCADVVWSLGVLCTTTEKASLLEELRRLVRSGGTAGLLVFVADEPRPAGAPEGNHFPSRADLDRLLADAGFDVLESVDDTDFAGAPLAWTERIQAVDELVARAHGDDPRFAVAAEQGAKIGDLLDAGVVTGVLVHAKAR